MLPWVQSMYWSVVTITTVGYGDLRPITTEGKALSMVISLGGVLMFALPAGILGSGFVEVMQVHLDEEHEATVRPYPSSPDPHMLGTLSVVLRALISS